MPTYRLSLTTVHSRRFRNNCFLPDEYSSYEGAKEGAKRYGKVNIWVKNVVVGTYNESYGYHERIEENKHDVL